MADVEDTQSASLVLLQLLHGSMGLNSVMLQKEHLWPRVHMALI
jgi:hypothetical protein